MAEQVFTWPAPGLPDNLDPGEDYVLAVQFTVSQDCSCVGVEWQVPTTAPSGTCAAALWDTAGPTLLASADFTPNANTLQRVYFDPEDIAALVTTGTYRAGIYTPDRYTATTSYTWPETQGLLTATANNGWLQTAVGNYPDIESGNDANFHVSPVVDDGSGGVDTSTASLILLASHTAAAKDVQVPTQSGLLLAGTVGSGKTATVPTRSDMVVSTHAVAARDTATGGTSSMLFDSRATAGKQAVTGTHSVLLLTSWAGSGSPNATSSTYAGMLFASTAAAGRTVTAGAWSGLLLDSRAARQQVVRAARGTPTTRSTTSRVVVR